MKLLDKVKGILFDEEEIEIPEIKSEPKKEVKKEVVEENPIKEIKIPKDDFKDTEYRSESTFTFPIDFEDDEVIVKEEVKPKIEEKKIKRPEKRDYSDFLSRKEEKKHFKPTPIISPVYGVLDQNYKKEDVVVKKDILRRPNELSLEEVRKRAFGSLEDDIDAKNSCETNCELVPYNFVKYNLSSDSTSLKTNLTVTKELKIEDKVEVKKEVNEPVEKPVDKTKTIGELIEEDSMSLDIPKIDSIEETQDEYNKDVPNDIVPTNSIEDLLSRHEESDIVNDKKTNNDVLEDNKLNDIDDDEADLFSLIDSMYEEKGE